MHITLMDTLILIVIVIRSSTIPINKRIDTLAVEDFKILDLVIIIPYTPTLMYITIRMCITRKQIKRRTRKNIKSKRKKLIKNTTNIGSTHIL